MSVLVFCEMSWVPTKQTLERETRVPAVNVGGDSRRHSRGGEEVREGREGSLERVGDKVLSFYLDIWNSHVLEDSVEGVSGGPAEGELGDTHSPH